MVMDGSCLVCLGPELCWSYRDQIREADPMLVPVPILFCALLRAKLSHMT